jgi:hypothetical protein
MTKILVPTMNLQGDLVNGKRHGKWVRNVVLLDLTLKVVANLRTKVRVQSTNKLLKKVTI